MSINTEIKLATGGPLGSTQQNLWVISATATDGTTGQLIPFDQVELDTPTIAREMPVKIKRRLASRLRTK